jgi:hypothetical protein
VPIRILTQSSSTSEIFAGVCLDGQGPFPFIVDTGSATTLIDIGLAKRLQLGPQPSIEASAPCSGVLSMATPTSMSVGALELYPQTVAVGSLSTPTFPLMGILGADVVSSFGVVRLDYVKDTMTVLGPQTVAGTSFGSSQPVVPKALLAGTRYGIVLRGAIFAGSISEPLLAPVGLVQMAVSIGGIQTNLVLDTGAQGTAVTPTVANLAHLSESTVTSSAYTFTKGCRSIIHYFALRSWRMGDLALSPQTVGSLSSPPLVDGGSLGSGTLQRYNPVVIDYDKGELLLGPSSLH